MLQTKNPLRTFLDRAVCLVLPGALFLSGCGESTLDSVMSDDPFAAPSAVSSSTTASSSPTSFPTATPPASPSAAGVGAGGNDAVNAPLPSPSTAGGGTNRGGTGQGGNSQGRFSRGFVPSGPYVPNLPKVSRDEFVFRIEPDALDYIRSRTNTDETRYLLVGPMDGSGFPGSDIRFVGKYEQDKQYQIRVNGIRVIVPIGSVDTLHRATVQFNAKDSTLSVKLEP